MLDFFDHSALGLDLSDLSFKIVQLVKKGRKIYVSSYVNADIPAGVIEDGVIKKEEELSLLIQDAFKKPYGKPFKGREVICNLPEEKVFIRVVQLPKMKLEELEQAIKWEAESHIPLDIDEVYFDWQVIEPVVNSLDHIDVLVGAAPRKLIDSYISLLNKSGLQPVALEPESVAITRCLVNAKDIKPFAVMDMGAVGTTFIIFSGRALRFSSHFSVSGQLINEALMNKLNVNKEEAIRLKTKVGLKEKDNSANKGKETYDALEPLMNKMADKIKEFISFYYNRTNHIHSPDKEIGRIILCGGDSLLPGLPEFISQKVGVSAELGDCWRTILTPIKKSKQKSLIYSVAFGLALRNYI